MEPTNFETMPKAIDELRNGQNRLEELVGQLIHQLNPKDKQEFLTLKQVCELTGYAAPTIYGLIGKNSIPHFKKGQRLFFEYDAIIAWIKEGKRKSQAEVEADADNHLKGLRVKK